MVLSEGPVDDIYIRFNDHRLDAAAFVATSVIQYRMTITGTFQWCNEIPLNPPFSKGETDNSEVSLTLLIG